jgi:hypothetical protein
MGCLGVPEQSNKRLTEINKWPESSHIETRPANAFGIQPRVSTNWCDGRDELSCHNPDQHHLAKRWRRCNVSMEIRHANICRHNTFQCPDRIGHVCHVSFLPA